MDVRSGRVPDGGSAGWRGPGPGPRYLPVPASLAARNSLGVIRRTRRSTIRMGPPSSGTALRYASTRSDGGEVGSGSGVGQGERPSAATTSPLRIAP